jgi:selenocysteine-specific elongation factor
VKVRGLQVHGAAQRSAAAGRRVAVNLGGVDVQDLRRGDTLTAAAAFDATRRFDALVDLLPEARPLRHGARVRFHHGTSELMGRIALASGAELPPGARGYARIRLEAAAVVTRGDRFILRAYSPPVTIGGGLVLDPGPARSPIRTAAAAARFARLNAGDAPAVEAFVESQAGAGIDASALARRGGLSPAETASVLDRLADAGDVVRAGDRYFAAPLARRLEERLLGALADHHRAHPMSEGMPREEARERVFGAGHPALFDYVQQRLAAGNRVQGRDRLAIAGHGVSLTPDEARARDALDRIYRDAGLAPPDARTAAASAALPAATVDRITQLLVRQKVLVKIDGVLFHTAALERLKEDVRALKTTEGATLDVGAFKGRYGVSRKYAIPLLEWLDRERVTRRAGDTRIVL